jgi:hypothetical protein
VLLSYFQSFDTIGRALEGYVREHHGDLLRPLGYWVCQSVHLVVDADRDVGDFAGAESFAEAR